MFSVYSLLYMHTNALPHREFTLAMSVGTLTVRVFDNTFTLGTFPSGVSMVFKIKSHLFNVALVIVCKLQRQIYCIQVTMVLPKEMGTPENICNHEWQYRQHLDVGRVLLTYLIIRAPWKGPSIFCTKVAESLCLILVSTWCVIINSVLL